MNRQYTVDEITDNHHKCLGAKKIIGVYKITNIKNEKIYIGSSKTMWIRWRSHIRELNQNKHSNMFLQEDWNKYGAENFVFEILEQCDESQRWAAEQKYLDDLFPFYRSGKGYNISENSTKRNEHGVRLFKPATDEDGLDIGDYYMVKVKGCKPHKTDGEYCRNTSREELGWECVCREVPQMKLCVILFMQMVAMIGNGNGRKF